MHLRCQNLYIWYIVDILCFKPRERCLCIGNGRRMIIASQRIRIFEKLKKIHGNILILVRWLCQIENIFMDFQWNINILIDIRYILHRISNRTAADQLITAKNNGIIIYFRAFRKSFSSNIFSNFDFFAI